MKSYREDLYKYLANASSEPQGAILVAGELAVKSVQSSEKISALWHQKRIDALVDIYEGFREYLDFLRRQLYFDAKESLDPMWKFNDNLDRNCIFLNDELQSKVRVYQFELLEFWNWAIQEQDKKAVQDRLDFEIPKYLDKVRVLANGYADPS